MAGWAKKLSLTCTYITNLRLDPFERTGWPNNGTKEGGQQYFDWFKYQFWRFVFVQQVVGKELQTFLDYPPMQRGASFNLDAVKADAVDAGLLIHEGQLLFPKLGLHRVIDLGVWWHEQTNLPLPLGGNAVRRALGPELGRQIARTIRDSVEYGLEHREEALNYAMQFARDMETDTADKFVAMYVNRWTLGYGDRGKQAVTELINRGTAAGLLPGPASVEFLSEA